MCLKRHRKTENRRATIERPSSKKGVRGGGLSAALLGTDCSNRENVGRKAIESDPTKAGG